VAYAAAVLSEPTQTIEDVEVGGGADIEVRLDEQD
jgi:hypothetical protein